MRILVDIGNSRCKSAIEEEDGLHPLETFAWKDAFLHEAGERVSNLTSIVTGGESGILGSVMIAKVIRDPLLVQKGVSALGGDMSDENWNGPPAALIGRLCKLMNRS